MADIHIAIETAEDNLCGKYKYNLLYIYLYIIAFFP